MLNAVFVTVALLTLSPTPQPSRPSPSPPPAVHAHARASTTALPSVNALPAAQLGIADPNALYSIRARKRFAAYLRLRLLELREEHLSRAAEAIERHISVSTLLEDR